MMNKRVSIKQLLGYCEKADLQALANLPPPDTFFRNRSINSLQKIATYLVAVWRHMMLLEDYEEYDLEVEVTWKNRQVYFSDEEAISWVLFVIASYYHHAAMALINRIGIDFQAPSPAINLDLLKEVGESALSDGNGVLNAARRFTFNYFSCLWGSFLLCLMHFNGVRNSMVDSLEVLTHDAAHRILNDLRNRDEEDLEWNLKWLLADGSFDALALSYYISSSRVRSTEEKAGYLDLDIHGLSSLANRDEFARERYGEKGIEREFELQLSILMQSFGFYVVPASPGEKSVDLICIPSSTSDAGTLMIDAKSSKHPYRLPTSDSRALEEYYHRISQTVTTIPKVTDILIVGGNASSSLPKRLRALESRLRVNVRFCNAEHLGILRRKLAGSLQPHEFFQTIRDSSHVIQLENLETLIYREHSRNDSLRKLIKTFMGSSIRIKSE